MNYLRQPRYHCTSV